MKKLLILSLMIAFYFNGMAQGSIRGFKVGGGLSLDIPASKTINDYSIGVGVDLLGHYGVTEKFAITGDIGYSTLFPKNKDNKSFNVIPIRAGIRFYPTNKVYFGGQAGVAIMKFSGLTSQSNFAYAVGGGYRLDNKLDIGLNYEGSSLKYSTGSVSFGYIGIRLGYFFN